ncbi:gamma-butyrobetaine dioxygenase-like [Amphiura filiformis]|uniref:gamma-butyrobetaine dioxygenase-like n=1 Tax=Amphiura filiformis TaxID=82378 RepID=UPI003B20F8BA
MANVMISNAVQNQDDKTLTVEWEDGDTQLYPYVWLRDNCQCRTVCWHKSGLSTQPGKAVFNLDLDLTPTSLEVIGSMESSSSYNLIDIRWSDGHQSQYESNWLRKYKFDSSPRSDGILDPKLRYWGSEVGDKQLKKYQFNDLVSSDEALLNWMTDLKELGIALIVNAPKNENEMQKIGERVNFLQPSHYGLIWKVRTRYSPDGSDHHNAAYKAGFLPLHTDLTYVQRPAGLMMLHCIESASDGGESLLSDGFKAAEELKRENPEAFKLLTTTIFESFDKGQSTDYHGRYHTVSRHSVIQLDNRGQISQVVMADHGRTPMLRAPVSTVPAIYQALKMFQNKLHDPVNLFKYKLQAGDIICLNNYRVLHGRADFKVTETTNRHLEGTYMDWDQVNLRMRVLQTEMDQKNINSHA